MPVPILTVAQMREWERLAWAAGASEHEVIRTVGQQAARRVLSLTAAEGLIVLLAGKGHNGDDVRAMTPHLADRRVEVLNVTDPALDLPDVQAAVARRPALVVDGLFGIGLNRPLSAEWRALIAAVNAANPRVLAVDVPSGLDADTGATHGAAIEAAITLAVGAPKAGLIAPGASRYVGRLEVLPEVGLGPCPVATAMRWALAGDFTGFPPRRPADGHKGSFGHLAILAGSMGFHGAAVLAARAAQRAQPGLITLLTASEVYVPVAAQLQAVMVNAFDVVDGTPAGTTALLIGPGLVAAAARPRLEARLREAWTRSAAAVVVDASALDWLPEGPVASEAIRVITPHPGEAARLLGTTAAEVQRDRLGSLRELSRRFGNCWVVLKGQHSLVGCAAGECCVNCSGNAQLAQGGSGDVLAGYLAGWLAQPAMQTAPAAAIRWAVWRHGASADWLAAGRGGWTVEDLVDCLGWELPGATAR